MRWFLADEEHDAIESIVFIDHHWSVSDISRHCHFKYIPTQIPNVLVFVCAYNMELERRVWAVQCVRKVTESLDAWHPYHHAQNMSAVPIT